MEHDLKLWATATLLVERYGQNAPDVALGWSRELTDRHEPEAAARCLEIADEASEILTGRDPLFKKARRRRRTKRRGRSERAA
jgi:hypothetical protein